MKINAIESRGRIIGLLAIHRKDLWLVKQYQQISPKILNFKWERERALCELSLVFNPDSIHNFSFLIYKRLFLVRNFDQIRWIQAN